MTTSKIIAASAIALMLSAAPLTPASATGSELHHYAPHQSGVKVNTPVLSPVEEKFAAIRNTISALRKAKTSSERNQLLNSQAANLDALQALLAGNAPTAAPMPQNNDMTTHRINRLERQVEQIQMVLERMMRR